MLQSLDCRSVIPRRFQILHAFFNVLPHTDALGIHHPQTIAFIGRILAFLQKCFSLRRVLLAAAPQQVADSQQIIFDTFRLLIPLQPLNRPRIVHFRTPAVEIQTSQLAAGIAVIAITGGFFVALQSIGQIALHRPAVPINIPYNMPAPEINLKLF